MRKIAAVILVAGTLCAARFPVLAAGVAAPTWPHTYQGSAAKVVVYQPQVKSWKNYTVLDGIAAIAVTPSGAAGPTYGTATFTAFTAADFNGGTVQITNAKVLVTHWPDQNQATSSKLDGLVRSTVQFANKTIPLASVLASMDAAKALPRSQPLNTDPPQIFESEKPAILVVFNGDPILAPIQGTNLKYAVNTNWNVIYDGKKYYLLDGDYWIASDSAQGPWTPVATPGSFSQIPNDANFSDIHDHLNAPMMSPAQAPVVFAATKPADMILIDGAPKLAAIAGTKLQYVSNSDNDLFQYGPTQQWYVLLSGRWFSSASLNGPWTFATNSLPADFSKIPVNSPRGRVLVSVPNTPVSQYAGAAAAAPQIAQVDPANTHINVAYAPGAPQFAPIQGTALQYATNTSYDVIKVSDSSYYACYNGVWFTASAPTGPWSVAASVPHVIYTIPPNSPLYQDTFVAIYDNQGTAVNVVEETSTATTYNVAAPLLFGFTAGYLGSYWWGGSYMYGTGYYWPPAYFPGALPIYYPYAGTYGMYYNSAYGAYGHYASAYGPYGGYSAGAAYNPATGTYARGAAAYGPNGSVAGGSFYNPRYGVGGATVQHSNPYGSWGHSAVSTPYGNAYSGHATTANGSIAASSTAHGNTAVAKGSNGDVYAGHDGNVYSNQNGSWQKYNGSSNSWSNVSHPSTSTSTASQYHPPAGSSGGFSHPNYTGAGTSGYHPSSMSSSTMSGLNRDYSARGAGSSGFSGFSGGGFRGGGGGGFRGR